MKKENEVDFFETFFIMLVGVVCWEFGKWLGKQWRNWKI